MSVFTESLKLPSKSAKKVSPVSLIVIFAPAIDSPVTSVILPATVFCVTATDFFSLSLFPAKETAVKPKNKNM
ncbi:MAG: hypothetical protein Q8L81_02560 [Bacteroidota bacterium]|nr:hypothetical protein [Bacteroidota bacterium]